MSSIQQYNSSVTSCWRRQIHWSWFRSLFYLPKKALRLHCESNILTFKWKQCFCFDSNTNLKIASNRIILWISIQQSSHFIVKIKLEFKQFHPLFSMNRRSTKQVNRFTITNRIQILIHISHLNLEFAFIIHWTSNPWTGPIYVKYS